MGRRVEEGRSPSATPAGPSAVPQRLAVVLLVFTALSLILWRSNVAGRYLSCWALFCLTLIFVGAPIAYPWYFIWPLSVSVIRWDHFGATTTLGCAVLTFEMLLLYTVPFVR